MFYSFPFDKTKQQPLRKQLSKQEDVPAVLSILQYCLQRWSLLSQHFGPVGKQTPGICLTQHKGGPQTHFLRADTQGEKKKSQHDIKHNEEMNDLVS